MNIKDFDFNNIITKHFEQHKSQGKNAFIRHYPNYVHYPKGHKANPLIIRDVKNQLVLPIKNIKSFTKNISNESFNFIDNYLLKEYKIKGDKEATLPKLKRTIPHIKKYPSDFFKRLQEHNAKHPTSSEKQKIINEIGNNFKDMLTSKIPSFNPLNDRIQVSKHRNFLKQTLNSIGSVIPIYHIGKFHYLLSKFNNVPNKNDSIFDNVLNNRKEDKNNKGT